MNIFMKKKFDNRIKVGYYRPCDILTMTGTLFAITAIFLSMSGKSFDFAVLCLIMSGICDCFDGYLARMHKYDKIQTSYGVELDSLNDVIAFGVAPAVITLCKIGFNHISTIIICAFYILAGLIRLAYYNTLDINKIDTKGYFKGFPITTIAIVYPFMYFLFKYVFEFAFFDVAITITLFALGLSFITPFKVKKPGKQGKYIMSGLGLLAIITYLIVLIIK